MTLQPKEAEKQRTSDHGWGIIQRASHFEKSCVFHLEKLRCTSIPLTALPDVDHLCLPPTQTWAVFLGFGFIIPPLLLRDVIADYFWVIIIRLVWIWVESTLIKAEWIAVTCVDSLLSLGASTTCRAGSHVGSLALLVPEAWVRWPERGPKPDLIGKTISQNICLWHKDWWRWFPLDCILDFGDTGLCEKTALSSVSSKEETEAQNLSMQRKGKILSACA